MRQDTALEERIELVLDESWQFAARAGPGVGYEVGCMLLQRAVQGRLLWAVAFMENRGAIRCPMGLMADGLRVGLPRR